MYDESDGVDEEGLGNNSLKTPLISNQHDHQSTSTIDTDDTSESGDEIVKTKAGYYPYLIAAATTLLAVGGMAASAGAIIAVPTIAVYIAGGMCMITSPWMVVKQHRIVKEGSGVRKVANQLRVQINLFTEEGQILKETVTDLEEEVECLHDIEKELDGIVDEQGWNRDKTVSLVNENESVLTQLKDCLREAAIADITRIVLSSDRDGDMTINLKELKLLTLRIKLTLEQRGVDLDEETFMALVRKDNCISHVLKVIATIMFEEDSIDDRDFGEYAKEALQETARQSDLVGSLLLAGNALNRMRQIARKDDKEEVDETPMFTIQDRFSRGSVDVARGTRVTLSKHSPPGRTSQVMRQTATAVEASAILHRQATCASSGSLDPINEVTNAQEASGENGNAVGFRRKNFRKSTPARNLIGDLSLFDSSFE